MSDLQDLIEFKYAQKFKASMVIGLAAFPLLKEVADELFGHHGNQGAIGQATQPLPFRHPDDNKEDPAERSRLLRTLSSVGSTSSQMPLGMQLLGGSTSSRFIPQWFPQGSPPVLLSSVQSS